jgi:3-oxoadipate enol-lactonase
MFDAEEIDGATIHCVGPVGPADGHALALVNALGCDLRIWDDVAPRLTGRTRLLRYDKRGHGLSDLGADGDGSIERHALDLAVLLQRRMTRPAVICGLSIGGLVAMALALTRPDLVCGLILCDTAPRIGTAARYAERAARIAEGGIEAIADAQMARWFSDEFRREKPGLVAVMRTMLARQDQRGYLASVAGLREADFSDRLGELDRPVLCLTGAEDASTPPAALRALADALADARYREIARAGHMPCIEQPERMAEAVLEFLAVVPVPPRWRIAPP